MEFWWSIPQKGASIGHLGARDDPIIRLILKQIVLSVIHTCAMIRMSFEIANWKPYLDE